MKLRGLVGGPLLVGAWGPGPPGPPKSGPACGLGSRVKTHLFNISYPSLLWLYTVPAQWRLVALDTIIVLPFFASSADSQNIQTLTGNELSDFFYGGSKWFCSGFAKRMESNRVSTWLTKETVRSVLFHLLFDVSSRPEMAGTLTTLSQRLFETGRLLARSFTV